MTGLDYCRRASGSSSALRLCNCLSIQLLREHIRTARAQQIYHGPGVWRTHKQVFDIVWLLLEVFGCFFGMLLIASYCFCVHFSNVSFVLPCLWGARSRFEAYPSITHLERSWVDLQSLGTYPSVFLHWWKVYASFWLRMVTWRFWTVIGFSK